MEPESSPPRVTPEEDPLPLPTGGPDHEVTMDQELVERFMSQVTESALGVLDFSRQWKEYEEKMELEDESLRKHALELQKREEKFEAKQKELSLFDEAIKEKSTHLWKREGKQDAEARDIEVKSKSLDLKEKKLEELMRALQVWKEELETRQKELSLLDNTIKEKYTELERREEQFQLKQDTEAIELEVRKREIEARQKELSLLDKTIQEMSTELGKREEQFHLKQEAESRDIEVNNKSLELKEKKIEELLRELEVRKEELEARQKELSLLDNTIKEKTTELEKREEQFQLREDIEAIQAIELELRKQEIEGRQKELSLIDETTKEKSTKLEKREEQFQQKQVAESREIEVKSKSLELNEKKLEEREKVLEHKEKELDKRSKQSEICKRSRDEFEPSFLAEKDRDDNSLTHPGKKHKPITERNHDDKEKETDSDCVLYGMTSFVPTSATASEAKGREVYEVVYIDDEADEDPEPYSCPDPDFNDFNNTMSSFSVGQVWALYDPLDHMPRYYAQIRKILKPQLRVGVTWLESKQTTENEKPIPIACGAFKYGEQTINSHLMFSHEMMHHLKKGKNVIIINPRKGETWALFRDWNSDREQRKRPYRYDFVQVLSELDSDRGIGVAYLGRVEGFTSVYELSEQHGIFERMIPSDEMLRFSHRVPSFKLTGDEKKGVPAGSFELDPAAIPRDCLEADKVKEEKIRL